MIFSYFIDEYNFTVIENAHIRKRWTMRTNCKDVPQRYKLNIIIEKWQCHQRMKLLFNVLLWICVIQCVSPRPDVIPRRHDMPLDVQKLESLGRADTLMQSLKDIAQQSHNCGVKEIPRLRRHYLKNTSITCNDRSRAGWVSTCPGTFLIIILGRVNLNYYS